MRTHKILRTQAFRIVVIYLAIFALSAFALVGFVYWNTARVLDRETDATIAAEVTGLVHRASRIHTDGSSTMTASTRLHTPQRLTTRSMGPRWIRTHPLIGLEIW